MELRYGVNPFQSARAIPTKGGDLPFEVVTGSPSYINVLDALNAWQLVRSLRRSLAEPAATSFKHVSPAGAALPGPIDEAMATTWGIDPASLDPISTSYLRARDADPKSSYGDFIAVSEPVTHEFAELVRTLPSDGIIAPAYDEGTIEVLGNKKRGTMLVLEIDPKWVPPAIERRDVFGVTLEQSGEIELVTDAPSLTELTSSERRDVILGMWTLLFTQSNSVGFVRDGMMIGIGAGQQSRVDCTRIAGEKVDVWWLRRHPMIRALRFRAGVRRQDRINVVARLIEGDLTSTEQRLFREMLGEDLAALTVQDRDGWLGQLGNVTYVSDGLVPFRDNVDHASRHGARLFVEPGGSIRSREVDEACAEYGMTHIETGIRLFHH